MAGRQDQARRLDEVVFHLAAGGALAVGVFTMCSAIMLPELAILGTQLVLAGMVVSWWLRHMPAGRGMATGLLIGAAVGIYWLARVKAGIAAEERHDLGLSVALHMTVPMVVAAYALSRVELAAFALVPGLSVMGLAAGQGDEATARAGFLVYLPLALLAVGYAMFSSGAESGGTPRVPEAAARAGGLGSWRRRHWPTLAGVILAIMLLAQGLYYPIEMWAEEHRWQLITAIATPGLSPGDPIDFRQPSNSYRIGQGPVDLADTPVLTTIGGYAPYWRGEVYDQYLGNAWGQTGVGGVVAEFAAVPRSGRMKFADPGPGRRTGTYRVTANAELPLIFYAPGETCEVVVRRPLHVEGSSHVTVNGYGVARVRGAVLSAGNTYQVTAASMESAVGRPAADPHVDERYLTTAFELGRVAELARQVAGSEPTPARKMAALIGHLHEHCTYSLEAPATPPGYDAVEYFLFEQNTGYCDLFASALAVMGRAVGVPTRLVTGYAFPDPVEGKKDTFVLAEADGHAWVEAFFPEAGGWTTLDPTPAADPSAGSSWLTNVARNVRQLWESSPLLATACAVLAVVLGFLFAIAVRSLHPRNWRRARRPTTSDWRVEMARVYLHLCHLLRRRGHPRHASQTPLEYLHTLEEAGDGVVPALPLVRVLTEAFVSARYRPGPVTEEEAQAAQETLTAVRQALRAGRSGG